MSLAKSADASLAQSVDAKAPARFNSDWEQLWIGVALVAVTGFIPTLIGNSYWAHTFQLVNLYIAVAVFQNLLFVDAGQKSFGQGAILGVGAYGFAIAYGIHGFSFFVAALAGVLASVVGGLLFALPALRVQGFHLGFVTMSAGIVFPQLVVTLDKWTNGINGISIKIPWMTDPLFLGFSLAGLLAAVFPMIALALHYALRQSRLGRRMRVAAASPEAAQSLGVKPGLMRCIAFIIACAGTGVAGALYGPTVGFVNPSSFNIELSFVFFFAVVVGGRGQLLGPIIGIWIVFILPNVLLVGLVEYRLLIYGCLTLAFVLLFPDGVVGSIERRRRAGRQSGGGEQALRLDQFMQRMQGASGARAEGDQPAVAVSGGVKRFGQVVAIDQVDLTVRPGEIHGLIGANGSGKTSLLNVLTGLSRLDSGSLRINGVDVTRMSADRIANLNVGRTFQAPRIFSDLSLWGNLRVGVDARCGEASPAIAALAADFERNFSEHSADLLSHGQRRLVEVMRTVLKEASILLFDEPAAGLSSSERENFAQLVRFLSRGMGKTIILVEHDLDLVWGIADRITVLETGRVIASGEPASVAKEPAVQHLFVGKRHA